MAEKKGWGAPLVRVDHVWSRIEQALCALVLVTEVLALCLQVTLNGLSKGYGSGENAAGVVYRAILGAGVLGLVAHLLTRPKKKEDERRHAAVVTVAIAMGLFLGRVWANSGVTYASNAQNWIQNASALMLIGGLRPPGLVSRLTLWLALLGGSLATSTGKHINIDVVVRFLPAKLRAPVAIVGWLAAAAMCFAAVVGFADNLAVTGFKVVDQPCADDASKFCPPSAATKVERVGRAVSNDLFLLGRQMSLDLKTTPRVLAGEPYDKYLTAAEWNAWMREADWAAHYPEAAVEGQMKDESLKDLRVPPAVNVPGGAEEARGLLVRDLNFVFPFGLLMIGLRFLLRIMLVLSGHAEADPDAALAQEEKELVHEEGA
jgi:TRAP-type C4-dicarboxylate transport system permease small subunit